MPAPRRDSRTPCSESWTIEGDLPYPKPFMPSDLAAAADENLLVHFTYAQARTPGMRVAPHEEVTLIDSGLPCDTYNAAIRTRLSERDAPARIREALDWFAPTKRPFAWWVGPGDTPSDLPRLLQEAGLVHAQTDPAMAADLGRLAEADLSPGGLLIRRVTDERALYEFARINAANWSPPDRFVIRFYTLVARALLAPDSPIRLYVGYLDGVSVGTSEVTLAGGVAGVYNVSTQEDYRRRGIGSAMTLHALLDAREAGCTKAILQAEPDGIRVYSRLGFEVFGEVTEYKPPSSSI
jgi:ribosomal protein S18 acetylase RimI-like enzyme